MKKRSTTHLPPGETSRFGDGNFLNFPGDAQQNAVAQELSAIRGELAELWDTGSALGTDDFRARPVRGSIVAWLTVAAFGAGAWLYSKIADSEKEIATLKTTVAVLEERLKHQPEPREQHVEHAAPSTPAPPAEQPGTESGRRSIR